MYSNKVEICGVNTAKLPVLMEKEKMELIRRCRQGDRQAREELVSGNLRLVLSVVQTVFVPAFSKMERPYRSFWKKTMTISMKKWNDLSFICRKAEQMPHNRMN